MVTCRVFWATEVDDFCTAEPDVVRKALPHAVSGRSNSPSASICVLYLSTNNARRVPAKKIQLHNVTNNASSRLTGGISYPVLQCTCDREVHRQAYGAKMMILSFEARAHCSG